MKQFEFANAAIAPTGSKGNMQPMVDNRTPSDSMPDWQTPEPSTFNSAAANNHGYSATGNGVGGAMGTHMGHDSAVPSRDDMVTGGDDKTGYGAA